MELYGAEIYIWYVNQTYLYDTAYENTVLLPGVLVWYYGKLWKCQSPHSNLYRYM